MKKGIPYQEVLQYIKGFAKENHYMPSQSDVQRHFGWLSRTSATKAFKRLEVKGLIVKTPLGSLRFPSELIK